MDRRLLPWVRTVAASLIAAAIFIVPIGLFMALTILVAAMEEGGAQSSAMALPLSQAIVLLSQGVRFRAGSVLVGIMPLFLTVLLILVVRTVCSRMKVRGRTWIAGAATWGALSLAMLHGAGVHIDDSTLAVLAKCVATYSLGFAWATLPRASWTGMAVRYVRSHVSVPVLHACRVGLALGGALVACMLLVGLGTVVAWVILGHQRMAAMADALGMQTGSRVLMGIMALAWLPNAMLWALAWLFGGSFHVGQAASYAMDAVQVHTLPSLPVFALFPQAMTDAHGRALMALVPCAIGMVAGLAAMGMHRGFGMRPWKASGSTLRTTLMKATYPLGAFCIAAVVLSMAMSMMFAWSNGSLGDARLAEVGVDVSSAANVVSRPCALGMALAWAVAVAIALASHALASAGRQRPGRKPSKRAGGSDSAGKEEKNGVTARVVNSTPTSKGEAR